MSRLAEIYKSEKKKGGGLMSALGKRTLEKIDPRQLFNQKGLAAAIAPSLFKTYSATAGKSSPTSLSTPTPQISTQNMESKIDILSSEMRIVGNNTRVAAKNSMSLPDMARDMNVMRQNVIKLVKLQGGEATNKADMYFKKSSENEAAYETQFSKQKGVSPTPAASKDSEKKGDGGLLGTLATIGLTAFNLLKDTVGQIVGAFGSLLSIIPGVTTLLSGLKTAFSVLEGALGLLASPAGVIFGLMASMGLAIKYFQDKLISKERELGGEKGAEMMSEQIGDMAAGAGDAMAGGTSFVTGTDVTGKKLGTPEDILQNRKDYAEQQKRQQGADTLKRLNVSPSSAGGGRGSQGGPTAEQLSPTPVSSDGLSDNLVNYVKKKEGFRAKAFWDHKQWSIGYGTKANSEDEVITEQEADSRLRDRLKKDSDYVNSYAKQKNYDWTQDQKDALTSFVYNLGTGSLKTLTDDGRRSNEQIGQKILEYNKASNVVNAGLVARRNEESVMFAGYSPSVTPPSSTMASASQIPPKPSTGSALTTASVQVASASQAGGTTVINNNTTNNNKTGGGQGSQGTPNIPSAFDDAFNMLFGRIA